MPVIDLITFIVTVLLIISSPIWIITCIVLFVKASSELDLIKKNKTKKWAIVSVILPIGGIFLTIVIRIIAHVVASI